MRNLIIVTLIAICFMSSTGYASEKDAGIITGTIVDKEKQSPVSSASIALLNQEDRKILASVASDISGHFEISHVPFGRYNLRVSSADKESKTIEAIEISEQVSNVKIGQIILGKADVFQLDEITVVGERLKGVEEIDRTVYTINDDIRKASTTGLDMLRHIPSVTVDFLNNVMLEGRSDIQFYVDGIKRNKEYVMQLDPQWIEKVELITNPSVKYDPDISGVISIILNKQGRFGINGSVTVPATDLDKGIASPAANIEYGSDRYRLYAGTFMHYEGFDRKQYLKSEIYEEPAKSSIFEKSTVDKVKWITGYTNYGVDWFVNDKTSINFLGEVSSWKEKSKDNIIDNRMYVNNTLDQYYKTFMSGNGRSNNYYFSLFLRRELEQEGCEFTSEMYFNKQSVKLDNEYADNYFALPELSAITAIIERREKVDDSSNTAQIKFDYSFLFKNIKNEIGSRTFSGWRRSNFENIITVSDSLERNFDDFNYDQWRQAAYYNALGEFKGIKWQLGLTGEYSKIEIDRFIDVDNFFILPQASIQRDFNNSGNIKLSFQRKIKRPEAYQLDPYERVSDSLHIRKGNPDLEPEVENNLELTYSKNFNSNFLSPKLYMTYTNNAIQDVTTTRIDGIFETTSKNIGKDIEYGTRVNSSFKITGRWTLNGDIAVYNKEVKSILPSDDGSRQQKSGFRFNIMNTFSLPKDYSIFLMSGYRSPYISYQREDQRDLLIILGFGKKFSDKADINLLYVPMIDDFTYSKSIIRHSGYYEENSGSVYVKNLFFVEFKYRFNYGKRIKKIERDVEYEKGQSGGGL